MACEFVLSLKTSLLRYEGACFFTAFVIPQGEKKSFEAAVYSLGYISCKNFYVAHFSAQLFTPLCSLSNAGGDLFVTGV